MISVGIPVVKTKFLREAIESVLNQTYEDFEIIILNNGKTSKDREEIKIIVNLYNDKRIKYYENDSFRSVTGDWNKCLSFAKRKYFVLFSDDDIYEETFLEELLNLAIEYPEVNIFHSRVNIINEEGEFINRSIALPEWESCIEFMWHRLLGYRVQYVPEFFLKTKVLRDIGGFIDFPLAWCSDDATFFAMAREKGIVATNKILCNWRKSEINISKIGNQYLRLKAVNEFEKWLKIFIKKVPSIDETDLRIIEKINESIQFKIDRSKVILLNNLNKNYVNYLINIFNLYIKRDENKIRNKLFLKSLFDRTKKLIKQYIP